MPKRRDRDTKTIGLERLPPFQLGAELQGKWVESVGEGFGSFSCGTKKNHAIREQRRSSIKREKKKRKNRIELTQANQGGCKLNGSRQIQLVP